MATDDAKTRVEALMNRALDWLEAAEPAKWQPAHWYWLKEFHQALTRPTLKPDIETKPNWTGMSIEEASNLLRITMQRQKQDDRG